MVRALLLGLLMAMGLGAQPVFTLTTEASATSSDGTSASSKVTVRLGPGTEWHGHFGTNYGGEDARSPQKLYKLRGGLYGLREAEPMGFGILSLKGSGVSHCIMCYTIGRAYCSKTPGVRYVIPPQERVRDPFAMVLCDTAKGSGTNDPGHAPESHHGDAARGNCKAQIVVSDRYMK